MKHRSTSWTLAALVGVTWLSVTACGSSQKSAAPPKASNEVVAATAPTPSPPMTLAASVERTPSVEKAQPIEKKPPVEKTPTADTAQLPRPDASTTALRSLTMGESPSTVEPSKNPLPAPPAKIDRSPQASADAAIKAVPSAIPVGSLSQSELEAPLQDRARFEHCGIPRDTHGEISAVVYNGAAVEVDVQTTPYDRALNFCIERTVRQTTWVKELAVHKVKVPF
jgi:hypothetical protein